MNRPTFDPSMGQWRKYTDHLEAKIKRALDTIDEGNFKYGALHGESPAHILGRVSDILIKDELSND